MSLYTKNGRSLQLHEDKVYGRDGQIVGRVKIDRVFGTDGRYVGTIVNDRLVYRAPHSGGISAPFSAGNRSGTGSGNRGGSSLWGDEPEIPD